LLNYFFFFENVSLKPAYRQRIEYGENASGMCEKEICATLNIDRFNMIKGTLCTILDVSKSLPYYLCLLIARDIDLQTHCVS